MEHKETLERPSTLLSGMLLWLLQYGSALLAFLFFAVGIGFVIMAFIQMPLINFFSVGAIEDVNDFSQTIIRRLSLTIGITFILISPLMLLVKYLSKLARTRNNYIEALEAKIDVPTQHKEGTGSVME